MKKQKAQFVVTEVFRSGDPAAREAALRRLAERYLAAGLRL